MANMRRTIRTLKQFFFPAPETPRWLRVLPYAVLGALTLILLVASAYAWDYTNSPEFCGTACHTMPPEYTRYLVSPHARVDCVECHIGRGFIATKISRKASDLQHVVAMQFRTYEYPITAKRLQPARETCERCHSPQKFSTDSLREIKKFAEDDANTPYSIYLIMHTGGGSVREGLGRGNHWHIESEVYYLPEDEHNQRIPYVRVVNEDGSTMEYVDVESDINPAEVRPEDLRRMDCVDCHNRVTHLILPPDETVDELMSRDLISPSIPQIRRKGAEVLQGDYTSNEAALQAIAGLDSFYRQEHPQYYEANKGLIADAITALQTAYSQSVFPEQKETWGTHPDNLGHKDAPGCLRCHDGKHLNTDGEAIRLECNICHSIPVVAGAQDFVARLEISRGPEPESHRHPNWITMHRQVFDASCETCHTTDDPGGTSNESFCANSACHGVRWEYAGFDAPALREIIQQQLPTPVPAAPSTGRLTWQHSVGPLLAERCGACHGPGGMKGLDLTSRAAALAGGEGGPGVVPGDVEASLVVQRLSADEPHFAQLDPEELAMLRRWIEEGAPEE